MTQPLSSHRHHNVGLMADSHGRTATLARGVQRLHEQGCRLLYHLGDICDSGCPETVAECNRIIRENDIMAVKGNNEHALAINYSGQTGNLINRAEAEFFNHLPLVRTQPGAVFTHSLPFERELGLSAMVRIFDHFFSAQMFFSQNPGSVLFRGHSHTPEIIYKKNGSLVTESLPTATTIFLSDRRPCVITCGALMDHLCLIWNSAEDWIFILEI